MNRKVIITIALLKVLFTQGQTIETFSGIEAIDSKYFKYPSSLTIINDKIIVSDTRNHILRKVDKNGKTEIFAGNGLQNVIEGNLKTSSFNKPQDIVIDSKQNIYVADNMYRIRKIDHLGNVTIYSGKKVKGWIDGGLDGSIKNASFKFIGGLAVDKNDNIYVADKNQIRKIIKNEKVITISGSYKSGNKIGNAKYSKFNQISDIATNSKNELYIADQVNGQIKKMVNDSIVSIFIDKGKIDWPTSIEVDNQDNLYIFDSKTKNIYVYGSEGKHIKTIKNNILKLQDFHFQVKIFIEKNKVFIPSSDFINIVDFNGELINQIGNKNGFKNDGKLNEATYNIPYDGVFDKKGNLYILDKGNYIIRKISKKGIVSHYAGSGKYGDSDGNLKAFSFKRPNAITIDRKNNLYLIDESTNKIKKIDSDGFVKTYINPEKEIWSRPIDIVCDSKQNIFVSDSKSNNIYKISKDKKISLLNESIIFGEISKSLKSPHGLALNKKNELFICDKGNNRVLKISKKGIVSEIKLNNNVILNEPENIAIDKKNNIYVTDCNRTRIIQISDKNLSTVFVKESMVGKQKSQNFNSFFNTLKIETFKEKLFLFDKFDHKILVIKK